MFVRDLLETKEPQYISTYRSGFTQYLLLNDWRDIDFKPPYRVTHSLRISKLLGSPGSWPRNENEPVDLDRKFASLSRAFS